VQKVMGLFPRTPLAGGFPEPVQAIFFPRNGDNCKNPFIYTKIYLKKNLQKR
jgi:hypothetical protein